MRKKVMDMKGILNVKATVIALVLFAALLAVIGLKNVTLAR